MHTSDLLQNTNVVSIMVSQPEANKILNSKPVTVVDSVYVNFC